MQLISRKSIRLKGSDYLLNGYYYITICSRDRENIFGEYKENNSNVGEGLAPSRCLETNYFIQLSKLGQIIENEWRTIPEQFNNVELDEYIIMPNHIHGILIMNNQIINNQNKREGARPSPTIVDVIRSFKSKCAVEYLKYIKKNHLNVSGKIWQRSFYDNIIRNTKSLEKIRRYVKENPVTWQEDKENKKNYNNQFSGCGKPHR